MKYLEVTIRLDEDSLKLFKEAARENDVDISTFLEDAGMQVIQKDKKSKATPRDQTGTKKRENSAAEMSELFDTFVEYLNTALMNVKECQGVPFIIKPENRYEWLDESLHTGRTVEDNGAMCGCLGKNLKLAMDAEDERYCYEVVRTIMDWGDVLYDRGMRKGNLKAVDAYYAKNDLLPLLQRSKEHIELKDLGLLEECSSGWTMIWCILDSDYMVMLSSRKVYALNRLLIDCFGHENLKALPKRLDFGQLVYKGNPRHIDGIRYVYTRNSKLVMLKKVVRVVDAVKKLGHFQSNKEIEDCLYTLGNLDES